MRTIITGDEHSRATSSVSWSIMSSGDAPAAASTTRSTSSAASRIADGYETRDDPLDALG